MTAHSLVLTIAALAVSGCIINTTEGTSSGGDPATSTAGDETSDGTEPSDTGDESDLDTSSSSGDGAESSSGGFSLDCSMCSEDDEPDPLCHSSFNLVTGNCECDPGYVFETSDPEDFTCVREEPVDGDCGTDPNVGTGTDGNCRCNEGYDWCSDDPADLTCCEVL